MYATSKNPFQRTSGGNNHLFHSSPTCLVPVVHWNAVTFTAIMSWRLWTILFVPSPAHAVQEEEDVKNENEGSTICTSSDILPFTAFFECCTGHYLWFIILPCLLAVWYGCLRVRARWDRDKEELSVAAADCLLFTTIMEFSLGFLAIFIDLIAAIVNFKVDGSTNASRCFAIGSCFHSFGLITSEWKMDGGIGIAILALTIGQILELVSFLFVNVATGYTAFIMIGTLSVLVVIVLYDKMEKGQLFSFLCCKIQNQVDGWTSRDLNGTMLINQFTLAVVVMVAFFSTLKGSYLLLLLPEVPVETVTYFWTK